MAGNIPSPAEIELNSPRIKFQKVQGLQTILLVKLDRNFVLHKYYGIVKTVRKSGAFVIEMDVEYYFSPDVLRTKFKPRMIAFRNSKNITIYLVASADQDWLRILADRRKAYAKARFSLLTARSEEDIAFDLLGIKNKNITYIEFKVVKRDTMRKWHPDLAVRSANVQEFLSTSKKYTDAISYVEGIIRSKETRLK